MTMNDETQTARGELASVLKAAGWSYYRAMLRYAWQLNWDSQREANPPALETLTVHQVRHLTSLLRTNQLPNRVSNGPT